MKKTVSIPILGALLVAGLGGYTRLDREAAPYLYEQPSKSGKFYFSMIPANSSSWEHNGQGAVFETLSEGTGREPRTGRQLWSVAGWYAFKTFLSDNGEYLVRLGNWPRGWEPSEEHLAIAFYRWDRESGRGEGIELKTYSTKDLIEDVSKVRPTRSHYEFIGGAAGFADPLETTFELTTVDGIRYLFDVRSGEVKERGR